MNAMPANVNIGAPWIQPEPVQCGSWFGIIATLRCRTATPFGRPVVPDVYMMSARSSMLVGTWRSEPSAPQDASSNGTGRSIAVPRRRR